MIIESMYKLLDGFIYLKQFLWQHKCVESLQTKIKWVRFKRFLKEIRCIWSHTEYWALDPPGYKSICRKCGRKWFIIPQTIMEKEWDNPTPQISNYIMIYRFKPK